MSLPVRHLPVIQNWDCHVCGSCCKEYLVTLTEEERRRIESQGWDKDPEIGDLPLFQKTGPWWASRSHWSCLRVFPELFHPKRDWPPMLPHRVSSWREPLEW